MSSFVVVMITLCGACGSFTALRLLDGMPPRSKVFGYVDSIDNPLTSDTHCLTACVYHFITWLVSDYQQPGEMLFLTSIQMLLFPKKSVI